MRLLAASVVAAGLLSIAVAAPAHAADPGWAQPGYGSGNTFYNPNESVINGASIGDVALRWTAHLPTLTTETCTGPSEPLVVGGRVFVTDQTGIGAYRLSTGALLWHFDWDFPDDTFTPHMAVSGGLLVAGFTECQSASDPNGGIVALNTTTGRQRWSVGIAGPVESLVIDKGIVAVAGESASSQAAVRAYRLSDGRLRWTLYDYWSPGVSASGKLLVSGTEDQRIAALSITTGKKLWRKAWLATAVAANPAGSNFYLGDDDGGLAAIKSANGATVWAVNGTGGPIAADGKRVYRGFSNSIEALNARTGVRLWTTRLGTDAGQPVRAGGLLYTKTDLGLAILTAATGVSAFTWPFSTAQNDHVVVASGWLFQVNGDTLEAYAP
ncbi:hypothetical protein KRM28CT15_53800 [Krasilnikovia sp. M28-CT-15]